MRLWWIQLLTTASVLWERLSVACWRLVLWLLLFAALWLFNIPQSLGSAISLLTTIAAVCGVVYFFRTDIRHIRWPTRSDVTRRIETTSNIRHRPLSSFEDVPVGGTRDALWTREQRRRARQLSFLKPAWPRAFIAQQDPKGIRFLVLLAFLCGMIVANVHWKDQIVNGLFPSALQAPIKSQENSITAWIEPPDYTRIDRITLETDSDEVLKIPAGSILKAFAKRSLLFTPSVRIDDQRYKMTDSGDGGFTLDLKLPEGQELSFSTGLLKTRTIAYELVPDTRPALTIDSDPEALPDGQVQFSMTLFDDYGVQALDMRMTLDPVVADIPLGWPAQERRSISSPPQTRFKMAPSYDLTAHPWAGLPVVFTFTAHDHIDQIAQAAPIKVVLPERRFTHPVAQRLIQIRKNLAWNYDKPYVESILALQGLAMIPSHFSHDTRVFLALRVARARLAYNDPSPDIARSVMDLLWDTALRLEDGNLSLAARELRDIQKQLENALRDPNISDQEIASLMQDLRDAMVEYMQAMAREMQKRMAEGRPVPTLPQEMINNMLGPEDLMAMMDQMEADMLSGDRNSAQDMLSKLQRMLDMANPSMSQTMPQDMQMMMDGINELKELIEKQETLRDQTQKQAELFNIMQGLGVKDKDTQQTPFINTQANKEEQEALRYILGQMMLEADGVLDEIPENFGLAERAMQNSSDQLGGNRPDESIPFQDEAIQHLKESQKQLAQQLAGRMQQMTGFSLGGAMPTRMDPLGRPLGGQDGDEGAPFGSKVKLPSEVEQKRVQDIINELRRRASERDRAPEALQYYRRLLKRF